MSALLSGLLPYLIAAGAALAAFVGAYLKGKSAGRQSEQAKQLRDRQEARDVGDEVDNDVGAMPPEDAREELKKWSR